MPGSILKEDFTDESHDKEHKASMTPVEELTKLLSEGPDEEPDASKGLNTNPFDLNGPSPEGNLKKPKGSPLEELMELLGRGPDTETSPSSSVEKENGNYDKTAKRMNEEGKTDQLEQGTEFVEQNPEGAISLAAQAGG